MPEMKAKPIAPPIEGVDGVWDGLRSAPPSISHGRAAPRHSPLFRVAVVALAAFAGDFNAQKPFEYDVFTEAGYRIANCSGDFGVHATLRNIPADNVVVSPGLAIVGFEVPQRYRINTDHFPVVAGVAAAPSPRAEKFP